jgi:hypothetical protein
MKYKKILLKIKYNTTKHNTTNTQQTQYNKHTTNTQQTHKTILFILKYNTLK